MAVLEIQETLTPDFAGLVAAGLRFWADTRIYRQWARGAPGWEMSRHRHRYRHRHVYRYGSKAIGIGSSLFRSRTPTNSSYLPYLKVLLLLIPSIMILPALALRKLPYLR